MPRVPNDSKPDRVSRRDRLKRLQLPITIILAMATAQLVGPAPAAAQTVTTTAVAGAAQTSDLRVLVARIALFPDDVLSLVLPASTAAIDVVEAVRFLDRRNNDPTLTPNPAWDPAVIALLNYPEALRLMDSDLDWTTRLSGAVTDDLEGVLDAIQSLRAEAKDAGYLASNEQISVVQTAASGTSANGARTITISSTDPDIVYVPAYNPAVILDQSYALAPPMTYPYPYLSYQSPAAPFFAGLWFGTAIGYGLDWYRHDIDAHFRRIDWDDINWGDVDWDKVGRLRPNISVEGDVNFNRFVNNGILKNTDVTALRSRIDAGRQNFQAAHDRVGDGERRSWREESSLDSARRQGGDRTRLQGQGLAPTQSAAAEGLRQRQQGTVAARAQRQRVGDGAARRGDAFGGVQSQRETGRATTRGRESLDIPRRSSAAPPDRPKQRQVTTKPLRQTPAVQQRTDGSRPFGGVSSGTQSRAESIRGRGGGGDRRR